MTVEYIKKRDRKNKGVIQQFKEIVYYSFFLFLFSVKHANNLKQGEELSFSFSVDPFE